MKVNCKRCAKREENGGDGCDNVMMTPIKYCFVATEEDLEEEDFYSAEECGKFLEEMRLSRDHS